MGVVPGQAISCPGKQFWHRVGYAPLSADDWSALGGVPRGRVDGCRSRC